MSTNEVRSNDAARNAGDGVTGHKQRTTVVPDDCIERRSKIVTGCCKLLDGTNAKLGRCLGHFTHRPFTRRANRWAPQDGNGICCRRDVV